MMKQVLKKLSLLVAAVLLLFFGSGCGRSQANPYRIGVDPSFFPLDLDGQGINVFAFTNELLSLISQKTGTPIVRVTMSWDNLQDGLKRGQYDAMMSAMPPNIINQSKYSFSSPYLETGPVLVVPKNKAPTTLADMKRSYIAIEKTSVQIRLMTEYPSIYTAFYESIPKTFEQIVDGKYGGALVPALLANAYIRDLFHKDLTIASNPLTDQALRLVTLLDKNNALTRLFNEGLQELIDSGEYQELIERWNLYAPKNPV